MLAISLLSMLTGWRTCVDMEDYGCATKPWLRTFPGLERHDWPGLSAVGKVVAGTPSTPPALAVDAARIRALFSADRHP